ncbi:Protein CLEC-47 [Aphelenchoides avenae]|nr:Protein CLEC-47 [Aphelenchus avenae]
MRSNGGAILVCGLLGALALAADAASSQCPAGWTYESTADRCYKYVRSPSTWDAALRTCRKQGGTLAQVFVDLGQQYRPSPEDVRREEALNQAVLNFVLRQSPARSDKGFHIGLRYYNTETSGVYAQWMDGPQKKNLYTMPIGAVFGDHYGDCVEVSLEKDTRGQWYMEKCDALKPAVCERPRR